MAALWAAEGFGFLFCCFFLKCSRKPWRVLSCGLTSAYIFRRIPPAVCGERTLGAMKGSREQVTALGQAGDGALAGTGWPWMWGGEVGFFNNLLKVKPKAFADG